MLKVDEGLRENKNKTVKGLVWGGVFSVLTQLIGLVFGIILARLLTPADYGLVGLLAIFTAIATLLQESGFVFVLTNKKDVTHEEYCTVFWFNVSVSAVLYCLLFFLSPLIAHFFNEPRLIDLSRLVFLSFLISSFGVVQSAYFYKNLKVRERGIITIVAQLISGIVGIVLAINGMSYWGIAIQTLTATIVTTSLLWIYSPFRPSLVFSMDIIKKLLPDGIKFAIPNFFSTISENIYSVILGKFFSVQDVGLYNQATKLNTYGYSIILNTFRNVSQPSLVNAKGNNETLLESFRKLFRLSVFLTVPIMMVISLVSSEFVIFLLSDKWADVGNILRIICIGGIFINLSTMFSYLVMSIEQSSIYMKMGILMSLLNIIAVFASIGGGIIWLALLSSLGNIVGFILYFLIVRKSLNYNCQMLLSDFCPVLLISILLYVFVYFATSSITNTSSLLFLRAFSFILGYLALVAVFKLKTYQEVLIVIKDKIKKV